MILHQKRNFGFKEDAKQMFNEICTQLENTNKEVRNFYFNLIRPSKNEFIEKFDFKFIRGDKVKTNPNANITTERKGMIWGNEYHNKEKKKYYWIFTEGKIHKRRYTEDELLSLIHI